MLLNFGPFSFPPHLALYVVLLLGKNDYIFAVVAPCIVLVCLFAEEHTFGIYAQRNKNIELKVGVLFPYLHTLYRLKTSLN